MSNGIVAETETTFDNPFDSIRRFDDQGSEFWTGRELQRLLGYSKWENFHKNIKRASLSCKNSGNIVTEHFFLTSGMSNGRPMDDWRLSRFACYLIAQNGDPEKPEIASAQAYFAVKTRQAEVIIPAQSERIKELELQLAIAQAQQATVEGQAFLLSRSEAIATMHGPQMLALIQNRPDAVVEVTRKVTETIVCKDGRTVSFEGQSLAELAKELGFKTGKQLEAWLRRNNADHLISQGFRALMAPYIPTEDISKVKELWSRCKNRQLVIGE